VATGPLTSGARTFGLTLLASLALAGPAAAGGGLGTLTKQFPLGTTTLCCTRDTGGSRARAHHSDATTSATTSTTASAASSTTAGGAVTPAGRAPAARHHGGGVPSFVYIVTPLLVVAVMIVGRMGLAAISRRRRDRGPAEASRTSRPRADARPEARRKATPRRRRDGSEAAAVNGAVAEPVAAMNGAVAEPVAAMNGAAAEPAVLRPVAVNGHRPEPARGRSSAGRATTPDRRTRDQLYAEAKQLGIGGRSKMNKAQLREAVDGYRR
jgi:hypothetical protein